MKRITSVVTAAVCAAAPLLVIASPAEAGTRWRMRASGTFAQADWIEFGELPGGVVGNVHLGNIRAEGDRVANVSGFVTDWTCPDGELPGGGGHGEEPTGNCTLESERFIFGDQVTLTVDRKLATARLTGTLVVENHGGGGAPASPPVDMTWTGIGGTATTSFEESYTDPNGTRYVSKRTETGRTGTVSGRIGAMGFVDDADDQSYGSFGTYKVFDRGVTP